MARRAVALGLPRLPGLLAGGVVLALTLGTLAAVAWRADGGGLDAADRAAIRFTLVQAALSAVLSVALAIPVARALARRRFAGRGVLVTLLGAPFILPVIVAVLGLLATFGRGGIVNAVLAWLGLPPVSIYGLHGVVLAHVFFNLPLAVRLILQGWLAIPAERFRVAASLNGSVFRLLEWPMLRAVVPGILAVIFLVCLTSFAVALTLGGGPRATTVELAIYQALRFDFDLGRAAWLAGVQFALCAAAAFVAWAVAVPAGFGAGLDRAVRRWDGGRGALILDIIVVALAATFLLVPLGMIVARGAGGLTEMPASIWAAAGRSVAVAFGSAALTIALTLAVVLRGGIVAGLSAALPLAASSLVMGTGLFILVFPFVDPATLALPVTALVNAAMALPFALRAVAPAMATARADYGRLAASLGLRGWAALRIALLPRLRRPLGFATGLAAALSMGDLGVVALFADSGSETLPLAMYRLMGAYRMDAAAGAALLLLALSLGLFWIFDRGGRTDAAT